MQGRSLLPLLRGERDGWPEEVLVQISESQVGRAVRTRRWKYGVVAPERDGQRDASSSRYEEQVLYDLEADPYELSNLVGVDSHRAVCQVMGERLRRRMVQAGEEEPAIAPAASRPGGQRRVSPEEARL